MARKKTTKALRTAGTVIGDESAVRCALAFARATDFDQALQAAAPLLSSQEASQWQANLADKRSRGLPHQTDWEPVRDQINLLLPNLARFGRLPADSAQAVRDAFNKLLFSTGAASMVRLGPAGLEVRDSGARRMLWGLAGFTVPGGLAPDRLAQCRLQECGRWFLRPPRGRGNVAAYCTPAHANLARVRAFRAKQKASR